MIGWLEDHETLEAFEKDSISAVFQVVGNFGADVVMRNNKNFNEIFIKRVGVSFEDSQQFEDGDLEERILDASDFILSVVFLDNHFVSFANFGNTVDNVLDKGFIETDDIFKEGHGA